MNILILNWRDPKNPKSGGAEYVTLEYVKAWVKSGHDVTWFTSNFKNGKEEENLDGIKIIRKGGSLSVYLLAPFFYLLGKHKFDFVVDQIHGIPFFTPLYVRIPKIAFIHEVAGEIWDSMYPFPLSKIGKLLEKCFLALYKNVEFMTVSDSTKNALIGAGIKKENIHIVLNGINVKPIKADKEKNPTFIFVSRVVKMKGIEEVIKAFFYILRKRKDSKLWIVGEGHVKYVKELKKMMSLYSITPRVKFFGRVTEIDKLSLMKKAHLLLHASVKEGWGLVVIEAASQGTPAVVYDVGGLRDSVKNGKTGIVLKNNNAKEMANQALGLLENENKYKIFQKNAIKWAKSLSWKESTRQSLELINRL
jgi:glycosyltransferase involved in cell wall biosynthesis